MNKMTLKDRLRAHIEVEILSYFADYSKWYFSTPEGNERVITLEDGELKASKLKIIRHDEEYIGVNGIYPFCKLSVYQGTRVDPPTIPGRFMFENLGGKIPRPYITRAIFFPGINEIHLSSLATKKDEREMRLFAFIHSHWPKFFDETWLFERNHDVICDALIAKAKAEQVAPPGRIVQEEVHIPSRKPASNLTKDVLKMVGPRMDGTIERVVKDISSAEEKVMKEIEKIGGALNE